MQIRGSPAARRSSERVLLDDVEMTIDLPGQVEWVVVNAGGHGFYRVSYSAQLFDALLARLRELKDLERYVLLDDANAFVLSGQLDAPSVLRLLEAYATRPNRPSGSRCCGAGFNRASRHPRQTAPPVPRAGSAAVVANR